ncbi:hypothetical protein [Actinomadura sp. 7K507]|uniref:hypothetical protein n=1 Tax=Actinomadura sp. 7K507 TaxID=2530365 RepID=UPI0014049FFF|nr:hypothetical protein [Actinomadura sp. 7K507]
MRLLLPAGQGLGLSHRTQRRRQTVPGVGYTVIVTEHALIVTSPVTHRLITNALAPDN